MISSFPGRSVFVLAVCILATPVVTDCGGGGPDKTAVSDEPTDPSELERGAFELAEAKESLDNGEYANAAVSFDTAYQYTGDVELLFEAALAVTRAKDWPRAHEKYIDYLERGQKEVSPEKTYMVRSEIDRLAAIIGGQEPVTWDSLADQVYSERAGERAPMEEPEIEDTKVGKVAAKKAAKEAAKEEKRKKEAAKEPEESKVEEKPNASGYKQVQGGAAPEKMPAHSPREMPSLQDLMFYAKSSSSTVRLRAVKDLITVSDDRARQVLEERMLNDTNMQVRFTAIRGLSARRSVVSIPVIRKARITAATSQERAVLKKAMDEIVESGW